MIMRAMVLAAGLGERMRPLTDSQPKPMLEVDGKPLLQYHIEALAKAGIGHIVINHSRYGEQIEDFFGNGQNFGVEIIYSGEGDMPLETAGGVKKALPLLGDDPFLVVNADIWTTFDFSCLKSRHDSIVHLVLVDNPSQYLEGDFFLQGERLIPEGINRLTYSGIGVYSPGFFSDIEYGKAPLGPLLHAAIAKGVVSAEKLNGEWFDIGTPERLNELNKSLQGK